MIIRRHLCYNYLSLYRLIYLILITVFLFTVYSNVYHNHYLIKDDYNLLKEVHSFPDRSFFHIDVQQGRFINAFITNWNVYKLLDNSINGKWFRLFSLFILSFISLLLYDKLFFSVKDSFQRFLLPLCIILLLPFQIIVLWVALMGSAFAIVFSILAFTLFWKFNGPNISTCFRLCVVGFLCAFLLEIIALNMYEPFAMFFWTMPALLLIMDDQYAQNLREWRKFLLLYAAAGFCSMLVRYLLPKIILPLLSIAPYGRTQKVISNIPELLGRLYWFIQEPFVRGLNFWNFPNFFITSLVISIIVAGIVLEIFYLLKYKSKCLYQSLKIASEKYFTISILILLSFTPNILVSSCEPRYRTFIAFTPILYLLFWKGCTRISRGIFNNHKYINRFILILLLVMGIHSATKNCYFVTTQNNFDRRYMESKLNTILSEYKPEGIKQFHIIVFGSRWKTVKHRLEFGYLTSEVGYQAVGMLCDLLHSKNIDIKKYKFSHSYNNKNLNLESGSVIIDMSSIKDYFNANDI